MDLNLHFNELFLYITFALILFYKQQVVNCSFFGSSEPVKIQRNISCEINPGCEDNAACTRQLSSSYFAVVHVKSEGPHDAVHYLWSNYKSPSFLVTRTSNTTSLTIDWDEFLNRSLNSGIKFSEIPLYSFGIILTELFEYYDKQDQGFYSTQNITLLQLEKFSWSNITDSLDATKESCSAEFVTTTEGALKHGQFKIQASAFGKDVTGPLLPHLMMTPESTQITWYLKDFVGKSKKSRYAMKLIVLSSEEISSNFVLEGHKTIDDEYSPGVFRTFTVTSSSNQNGSTGYLIWKPVAYTDVDRLVAHSSDATIKKLLPTNDTELPKSVATSYFLGIPHNLTSFIASFGTSGDSFYSNTNYTEWTLAMGYGMIREEKMSQLVILVIAIGLGLPVVILISGGIYLGARKLCYQKDELLLDREDRDQRR